MAEVITMPRLSDTMEEGTVATWLKKVGDKVVEGDILAEIETDKATMDFESFYEGTLLHIGIAEGETAQVDALLAIIGEKGEDISELLKGDVAPEAKEEKKEVKEETTEVDAPKEAETTQESETSSLPDGVQVINMPRLSDTMEEGTVATWLKKEGDTVEEGDILAEIETDKATMEFESFYSGTLLKIGIAEGESAKVDTLLAIIGPAGTDVSGITQAPKAAKAVTSEEKKETPVAIAKAVERKTPTATKAEVVKNTTTKNGRIFISPLAKKLAEEKGISLNQIQGSGENGRIVKRDIENYQPAAGGTAAMAYTPVGEESFEEVANSQMRKTIAKRLGESKFTAPHYYLTVELDMDGAMASRTAINSAPDVKISYNDMIVKACAMALRKHPQGEYPMDG